ncbi:transcription repressor NadR [Celerinatantimonas diazotrophica]|uniref:Transcriptional regulator n=1 Tax=Celerinatantimonas diazotrophica TaxID=412034 RepID=A0A4R1J8D9_9GAMM|nr:transcription repressor NadR [Celerinatantimonas diazotrophica]TCK46740.1 hypothetical protein EV690_3326 [Celerinatantimonas diazotrophica]CAG9295442.1 Transcription repressor NadR [Celerinatantimonas diazotrophica]
MGQKLIGEQRRARILELLKQSSGPLTGSELAQNASVSRQVIVQDIALLKARNEPIIPTSQGYIYHRLNDASPVQVEQIVACQHDAAHTESELLLMVDYGLSVKNVIVEHALYGEITAQLQIRTRKDVEAFMQKMRSSGASYLFELTGGVHLHTLCAPSQQMMDEGVAALREAGFLVNEA